MDYFQIQGENNAAVVFVERGVFLYAHNESDERLTTIAELLNLKLVQDDGSKMLGFPKIHAEKNVDVLTKNGYSVICSYNVENNVENSVVFVERGAFLCAYERNGVGRISEIADLLNLKEVQQDDGLSMIGSPKIHMKKNVDVLTKNGHSVVCVDDNKA
mgnify:CR=1 FL=1